MIHPGLRDSLRRIEAHFQADRRCAAMYLWGSLGNETADAYSDVDIAIVVHDLEYQAVKSELRSLCETLCGPVLAWLPEGERPQSCNFAFLFACDDAVLLYDFYLSSVTEAHKGPGAAFLCRKRQRRDDEIGRRVEQFNTPPDPSKPPGERRQCQRSCPWYLPYSATGRRCEC